MISVPAATNPITVTSKISKSFISNKKNFTNNSSLYNSWKDPRLWNLFWARLTLLFDFPHCEPNFCRFVSHGSQKKLIVRRLCFLGESLWLWSTNTYNDFALSLRRVLRLNTIFLLSFKIQNKFPEFPSRL